MNITELARRLKVPTDELREKLPELGFSIGRKAIKINDREAHRITEAWNEFKKRERLQQKMAEQKARAEAKEERKNKPLEKKVELPSVITVREFASRMDLPVTTVIQELMRSGILASMNERIDFETAGIVAEDLGFEAIAEEERESQEHIEAMDRIQQAQEEEKTEELLPRAPVVVVMGHVDHGKTKLLDAIRKTNVVEGEAGGITQHIGAYQVEKKGQPLTFIDTPGHEAFTVMRSRGAKVADIAILVVAADDGVQPQTREAIDIVRAAKLPLVIAINKIDKPEANVEKVKKELSELNLVPEDWGGDTICVPISAKQNQGIDDILDVLLLVAEMEKDNIVANPNRKAIGTFIESHIDKGEGPVATILIQAGTLRVGDPLGIRGMLYGKVRAMKDYRGKVITEASPSMPVKILGFKVAPIVGDILEVPENIKELEKVRAKPQGDEVMKEISAISRPASEDDEKKILNLIIRADTLGSLEAILGMFEKIKDEQIGVKVISKGLGNIGEADVLRAEATGALVIGFHVSIIPAVVDLAREKSVEVLEYQVIYKLYEDIVDKLQVLMPAEEIIEEIGKAEVLVNFKKLDNGSILGAKVIDGKVKPGAKLRIYRNEEVIGEGEIDGLQIGKQDVTDVGKNQEFGMRYKGKCKVEVGDKMEVYLEIRKERKLQLGE